MEGKTKTIGLVLDNINQNGFYGYFTKIRTGISLDEFSHLTLEQEVIKTRFWCQRATGRYWTHADTLEEALEVGRQLKCIGIENPQLFYNGKEKPISEWQI